MATGTYYRAYDVTDAGDPAPAADGGPTREAHPASVTGFRLDKYLVTVGRFRQFVAAWNFGLGWTPQVGSGKHTYLNGGQGLANSDAPGTYESGWPGLVIDPSDSNLACDTVFASWTTSVGSQENLPINCVTWPEAYAFCIWDGGFLPSEAEWEYAAAGGSQQREYPWGSTVPGTACPGTGCEYAIYDAYYPNGLGSPVGVSNLAPVGTATLGAGLWGQLDMAGEVSELVLDSYAAYVDPCTDCAYIAPPYTMFIPIRGGDFLGGTTYSFLYLLSPYRNTTAQSSRAPVTGFRCARAP